MQKRKDSYDEARTFAVIRSELCIHSFPPRNLRHPRHYAVTRLPNGEILLEPLENNPHRQSWPSHIRSKRPLDDKNTRRHRTRKRRRRPERGASWRDTTPELLIAGYRGDKKGNVCAEDMLAKPVGFGGREADSSQGRQKRSSLEDYLANLPLRPQKVITNLSGSSNLAEFQDGKETGDQWANGASLAASNCPLRSYLANLSSTFPDCVYGGNHPAADSATNSVKYELFTQEPVSDAICTNHHYSNPTDSPLQSNSPRYSQDEDVLTSTNIFDQTLRLNPISCVDEYGDREHERYGVIPAQPSRHTMSHSPRWGTQQWLSTVLVN